MVDGHICNKTFCNQRLAKQAQRAPRVHSSFRAGRGLALLCFGPGQIWGVCVGPGSLETGRPGRPTAYYILYVCVCVSEWVWDDFCDSNAQRAKQRRHELQNTCAASGCPPLKCPWQSSRPSTNPNIKVPSVFSLRYPFCFFYRSSPLLRGCETCVYTLNSVMSTLHNVCHSFSNIL